MINGVIDTCFFYFCPTSFGSKYREVKNAMNLFETLLEK
jgi:hypothetical protein